MRDYWIPVDRRITVSHWIDAKIPVPSGIAVYPRRMQLGRGKRHKLDHFEIWHGGGHLFFFFLGNDRSLERSRLLLDGTGGNDSSAPAQAG